MGHSWSNFFRAHGLLPSICVMYRFARPVCTCTYMYYHHAPKSTFFLKEQNLQTASTWPRLNKNRLKNGINVYIWCVIFPFLFGRYSYIYMYILEYHIWLWSYKPTGRRPTVFAKGGFYLPYAGRGWAMLKIVMPILVQVLVHTYIPCAWFTELFVYSWSSGTITTQTKKKMYLVAESYNYADRSSLFKWILDIYDS